MRNENEGCRKPTPEEVKARKQFEKQAGRNEKKTQKNTKEPITY